MKHGIEYLGNGSVFNPFTINLYFSYEIYLSFNISPIKQIWPRFTCTPLFVITLVWSYKQSWLVISFFLDNCFQVTVESQSYHKSCFKCSHGGCAISPSNYAALEGILYCKHHFSQLFKEKGSYNHLLKSASMKRAVASVPEAWPPIISPCLYSIFRGRGFAGVFIFVISLWFLRWET